MGLPQPVRLPLATTPSRQLAIATHPIRPPHLLRRAALGLEELRARHDDDRPTRAARCHVEAVGVEEEGHAPRGVLG